MSRRSVVVAVVAAIAIGGLVGPTAGASSPTDGTGPRDLGAAGSVLAGAVTQADNNTTTIRHANPETTREDGDISRVESVLADQMREIVVDCSEDVQVGEYDACDRLNGSYSSTLSKYVNVTGGGGGGDEDTAETLRETRNRQQNYTETVREYRTTYEKYQEARQNGNTTRARRLARKLLDLRSEADQQGRQLRQSLNRTQEATDTDLTAAAEGVSSVNREVNETTSEIERTLFEPARLELRSVPTAGAFDDPLRVEGTVTATNGTALRNETVVILANVSGPYQREQNRTQQVVARTETDTSGQFRFDYRPAVVHTGDQSFTVRYLPQATSKYTAADAGFEARIRQTEATVRLERATGAVKYREQVSAEAELVADGVPVARVPLSLSVDGRRLALTGTDANGTARMTGRLPLDIGTGERRLRVAYAEPNRAIRTVNATKPVQVRPTRTELSVRIVQVEPGDGRVRVTGQLRTVDGIRVPGRRVGLRVGGQRITTLKTNRDGEFRGSLNVSQRLLPDEPGEVTNHTFTAVFESRSRLNLRGSDAAVTVPLQSSPPGPPPSFSEQLASFLSRGPVLVAGGGGGLVLAVIVAFLLRRREGQSTTDEGAGTGEPDQPRDDPPAGPDAPGPFEPLETARDALADGAYEQAILSGYVAARRAVAGDRSRTNDTHWEFYRTLAEEGLDEDRLGALRRLTEAFERTTYADATPDRTLASDAVAAARTLAGDREDEELAADGSGSPAVTDAEDEN